MKNITKRAEIKHSETRRIAGSKRSNVAKSVTRAMECDRKDYAEIAELTPKQFKAFIYLIATAIDFKDADSLIHKYYPRFREKEKLHFLTEHFNICGIFGKNLNTKIRYLFVVKSILSAARNMGTDFVIKK